MNNLIGALAYSSAMAYQPIARPQKCGESSVCGYDHFCIRLLKE